ncbi:hypothetical protein G7K_1764-t2 [Saitoella complicata NRRL Y-17804]|uniref:Eukaryotic translation initiation factor 3 subunit C n=1 Tax=Saitoella complicata (strain BCRC 22490 / CBS 7301 / JCM 7358 / NBRC 10748 / NRRL Y-17804) TaxID=698492 RepID=A0A0E9NDS7_SAICN|nr:hypothetical protein G7K_1764-t2 [Saitoella complicata NRRL Y-17804]
MLLGDGRRHGDAVIMICTFRDVDGRLRPFCERSCVCEDEPTQCLSGADIDPVPTRTVKVASSFTYALTLLDFEQRPVNRDIPKSSGIFRVLRTIVFLLLLSDHWTVQALIVRQILPTYNEQRLVLRSVTSWELAAMSFYGDEKIYLRGTRVGTSPLSTSDEPAVGGRDRGHLSKIDLVHESGKAFKNKAYGARHGVKTAYAVASSVRGKRLHEEGVDMSAISQKKVRYVHEPHERQLSSQKRFGKIIQPILHTSHLRPAPADTLEVDLCTGRLIRYIQMTENVAYNYYKRILDISCEPLIPFYSSLKCLPVLCPVLKNFETEAPKEHVCRQLSVRSSHSVKPPSLNAQSSRVTAVVVRTINSSQRISQQSTMSRFFRASSDTESSSDESEVDISTSESGSSEASGSESESDSEESSDDSDNDSSDDDSSSDEDGPSRGANRFLKGGDSDDSDEEEETKRVVKSAKDKRYDEIVSSVSVIANATKINDWVTISTEFDKLNKLTQKTKQLDGRIPRVYIKAIGKLEDALNESVKNEKQSKKKMNASNARALNSLKQRIRKNNRDFESEIAQWRANPESFENEDEPEPAAAPAAKAQRKVEEDVEVDGKADGDDGFSTVGKKGRTEKVTAEDIFKQLRAVVEARGKKNTDRNEQISILEKLVDVAITPYQKLRIFLALISARFDATPSTALYMASEQWEAASKDLSKLFELLEEQPKFMVAEDADDLEDEDVQVPEGDEVVRVRGSVIAYVDRLDDELTKALQHIDPHTSDYVERMKHEAGLYYIIVRSHCYFERVKLADSIAAAVARRLEHVYFKPEQVVAILEENTWKNLPQGINSSVTPREAAVNVTDLVQTLCVYLYKNGQSLHRTRAMLCHIYHHALHNRYHQARDLLLMSHLQESIHQADIATQILHNRTMVQLGLCAFRAGMVNEAQQCLQEICSTGRIKELLAQGVQRYNQVSPEQERMDRQRQLPFHMHINLELLECVYLTCSMLLEIPAMAAAGSSPDAKKRVISRPFRRMLDFNERQVFVGPPENTRDHIMQAAKALAAGEWQKARELISAIKIWDLMPNTEEIKTMLGEKIQEEGLRTYLFTYASFYETMSIASLSEMFDLSERSVTALVSRMISHEEIPAAFDQVSSAIIFQRVEPSRLQALAIGFADKANHFVEANERLLESKTQTEGERRQGQDGRDRRQRDGPRNNQTGGRVGGGNRGRGRNNFNSAIGRSVRA